MRKSNLDYVYYNFYGLVFTLLARFCGVSIFLFNNLEASIIEAYAINGNYCLEYLLLCVLWYMSRYYMACANTYNDMYSL